MSTYIRTLLSTCSPMKMVTLPATSHTLLVRTSTSALFPHPPGPSTRTTLFSWTASSSSPNFFTKLGVRTNYTRSREYDVTYDKDEINITAHSFKRIYNYNGDPFMQTFRVY